MIEGEYMLSKSDTPIDSILDIFSSRGLDVTFLVPTATGYEKSIMDAIVPLRNFLELKQIHNYSTQKQGPEYKILYPTTIICSDKTIESTSSLYRPKTKQGDPRIWINGIKNHCIAGNLLGIIADKHSLYVFNLSNQDVVNSMRNNGSISEFLDRLVNLEKSVATELLGKLNAIHSLGFVESVTAGDTGVGMTCESLLGIAPNTSKAPDYKGIEIKCSRKKIGQPNRVNLYTQVPDWKNSAGMTASKLLQSYGYWSKKEPPRFDLYCTVEANHPNPQGLYFKVDMDRDLLINYCRKDGKDEFVVQWDLQLLRERLLEKHRETFWIKATSKIENGLEYFKYDAVVHTKKPTVSLIGYLIDSGIITMDYTMHFKENGTVRDHGYIFKIKPKHISMLFPNPVDYIL